MRIPEGTACIGSGAFYGCTGLEAVYVPASVARIGRCAFGKCPVLTIHAPAGSRAERYAAANGIRFETT